MLNFLWGYKLFSSAIEFTPNEIEGFISNLQNASNRMK